MRASPLKIPANGVVDPDEAREAAEIAELQEGVIPPDIQRSIDEWGPSQDPWSRTDVLYKQIMNALRLDNYSVTEVLGVRFDMACDVADREQWVTRSWSSFFYIDKFYQGRSKDEVYIWMPWMDDFRRPDRDVVIEPEIIVRPGAVISIDRCEIRSFEMAFRTGYDSEELLCYISVTNLGAEPKTLCTPIKYVRIKSFFAKSDLGYPTVNGLVERLNSFEMLHENRPWASADLYRNDYCQALAAAEKLNQHLAGAASLVARLRGDPALFSQLDLAVSVGYFYGRMETINAMVVSAQVGEAFRQRSSTAGRSSGEARRRRSDSWKNVALMLANEAVKKSKIQRESAAYARTQRRRDIISRASMSEYVYENWSSKEIRRPKYETIQKFILSCVAVDGGFIQRPSVSTSRTD